VFPIHLTRTALWSATCREMVDGTQVMALPQ